jgi:hypothetical protein
MRIRIEGFDLPGRRCEPPGADQRYANVHIGVQRGREVVELVAGDAESATWSFEATDRTANDGSVDHGGPFVHGRRGDRFLYLSWGTVEPDGAFAMFRRAKLHLADIDAELVRQARRTGSTLVGRVALTDNCGAPRCARVRPPDIVWSVT